MKQTLVDCRISIKPSQRLVDYIVKLNNRNDMPLGILNVRSKSKLNTSNRKAINREYFTNKDDLKFIESLKLDNEESIIQVASDRCDNAQETNAKLLNLEDLYWLRRHIRQENKKRDEKIYFHELFHGSEVILPQNEEVPRNPELEERCRKLKTLQENRIYKSMTKNVDSVRYNHPEDTIAYQMKQINRHLIAIVQFIISVLAGFAFGFIGVELIIGKLDFGFRLLLGIICALVIALAELYFLAKKLNEDLEFEAHAKNPPTSSRSNHPDAAAAGAPKSKVD